MPSAGPKVILCLLLLASLCFLGACGNANTSYERSEQREELVELEAGKFLLRFFQRGEEVAVRQGVLQLQPEDFMIEVNTQQLPGVYAHLCTAPNAAFEEESTFQDLPNVAAKTVATTPSNEDNELIVDCNSYSYWYNQKEGQSSFNDLVTAGERARGRLSVNGFFFPEGEIVMDVGEMADELFLYVFSMRSDSTSNVVSQGQYIKILWL
ncbi:MAG: hypothetical protein AAF990_28100 [Bacteroidota bacterium]